MRKWLIFLLILVVVVVGGYILWDRIRQQQRADVLRSLQTVKAVRGDLVTTIGGTGTVETNQTAVLSWQTSGIIEVVDAMIGDLVKTNQVLASLRQTSLSQNVILAQADLANAQKSLEDLHDTKLALTRAEQAVVQAREAVRKAQARVDGLGQPGSETTVDSARATVLLAKINLDKAWDDYKPYENKPESNQVRAALFNKYAQAKQQYDQAVRRLNNLLGSPSDLTVELTESDLSVAQANLEDAIEQYDRLKTGPDARDVAALEARIAAAQATLDMAHITAPFNGTVTEVYGKAGDQVAPGTAAFRLDDLSHLLVRLPVSEVDISRVIPGQEAVITFDAIPDKTYRGLVSEVARVGMVNQGVVDFGVTIELTDADERVKPGMTAAVNIIAERLNDVLLVPNRAVRVQEGQRVVYILANGIPQSVEITLGASSELDSQVLSGDFQEGDEIVLNPPVQFEFGQEPSFVRNMRGIGR
jgi:HlyD family secretion protein